MAESTSRRPKTTLTLSILAALLFLASGAGKLSGAMDATLTALHVPAWAIPTIGALEVLGAVALLVPRTRSWAALGLTGLMAGAAGTHILNADWLGLPGPIIPGTLVALVAWWDRPTWVQARIDRLRGQPS